MKRKGKRRPFHGGGFSSFILFLILSFIFDAAENRIKRKPAGS
jgi:Na+/melibiose symporter-like transporter